MEVIYLDNNATTLIDPRVVEHMSQMHSERFANPSSQHSAGRKARKVLEIARESLLQACGARTVGMESDQLLFTSGGTESNNLAIFGLAANRPGCIVVSRIEHPSVLGAAEHLRLSGRTVRFLDCDRAGAVDVEQLRTLIEKERDGVACVSLMLANNETGVVQPVLEAGDLCRRAGIPLHTDAVQGFCKIPLNFRELCVDAMTITSHKLHGPLGIGALVLRHGVQLAPHHFGGFQQMGMRPGTEMPVLASGFATAVGLAKSDLSRRESHMRSLRLRFESAIREMVPWAVIAGEDSERLPHTSCIAFAGVDRQALQMALDQIGVACSTGSACASGSSQPSHVLQAMKFSPLEVQGAVRFSLSFETTTEEVDAALQKIGQALDRLPRNRS
jgi:cysteine desulfurase